MVRAVVAEGTHEQGRKGAKRAKRWLEATTKVSLPWNAYDNPEMTAINRPDGSLQRFDLVGTIHLGAEVREIYVEVKQVTTVAHQPAEYQEYLADAYFATIDKGVDRKTQFMWVTWHPFSQGLWPHLCGPQRIDTPEEIEANEKTVEMMKVAVESSPFLGGHSFRPEVASLVVRRLWMVVLHDRQEAYLTLSDEVAAQIRTQMLSEAGGL